MTIKQLRSSAELKSVEQLQRDVWGCADIDILAPLSLRASLAAGALLLGAFDNETIIGFSYAFPALHNELHSDMTGILDAYRDKGIGYQLKLTQKDYAIRHGIQTITWTFDPLRSRNAYFNFNKLGATSDSYRVDFYGSDSTSFLHQNSTDRLWVTWRVDQERFGPNEIEGDLVVSRSESNAPMRHQITLAEKAVIEIPLDPDALPIELAREWRSVTRTAFLELFQDGFTVTGAKNGRYQLERSATLKPVFA